MIYAPLRRSGSGFTLSSRTSDEVIGAPRAADAGRHSNLEMNEGFTSVRAKSFL